MSDALTLRVITPDRVVLDTTASSIRLPALDGSMGILSRHAPMVAALSIGELVYRHEGREEHLFVSGGFAEVRDNTVRVVSEAGERPADIDEERARAAEARARGRLDEGRGSDEQVDLLRAELALRRAQTRLRVKTYSSSLV